jgi:hypothetical protein
MKQKIFIKQWLELKPYNSQTSTDSYYLKLANDIKKSLSSKDSLILLMYLTEEEINMLSCFLASWFEDIITGTNIWNSFVSMHFEKYGKKLPFYNTNEYSDGEIYLQDVTFLLWYFMNTIQNEKFISPYNEFLTNIALKVMLLFDEEYDYAPENEILKSFYESVINETDFYKVRTFVDAILFKTYLFYTDTAKELTNRESELLEKHNDKNIIHHLQEARDNIIHTSHTRLMNITGKEWAAKILGNNHPVGNDLLNMSQTIRGYFFYKGQDNSDIFLEHISSAKKFKLTKKSFDHSHMLTETDTIMFLGIVRWREEWWFSGVYFQLPFNADLVLDEKNSLQSRKQVSFLDYGLRDVNTTLDLQYKAFLRFNNDSPVAFMPTNKIEEFTRNYLGYFNDSLNLTSDEKEQAHKRARADGFFGDKNNSFPEMAEKVETGLVFFNPKSGVEIAVGLNRAFALPNNPWVDVKNSKDDIFNLFFSEQISTELTLYCIEKGKNKLPFLKKGEGKWLLDDIDFLLRFWKKTNYQARPGITYTGQNG